MKPVVVFGKLFVLLLLLWPAGFLHADEVTHNPFFDLNGQPRTLQSFQGQLIILNIFATWCGTCIEEIPDLNRLSRNGRGKWVVLSVGSDLSDSASAQAFGKNNGIRSPLFYDPDEKFSNEFPVRGFPYFAIISPQGKIVHQMLGAQKWESRNMLDYLDALTSPTGKPLD